MWTVDIMNVSQMSVSGSDESSPGAGGRYTQLGFSFATG
jgi:hypothetical protein